MHMPTNRRIDFILERNREQSALYTDPGVVFQRRLYRAQHPTEIVALKCMDGRLNLPVMTNTPTGIIQPFRNIGGKFDLGWPLFSVLMREWVEYAVSKGRHAVVLVTHHFAKGDEHRGCKGFGYDTTVASMSAEKLKRQFEEAFGRDHQVVYPIHVGIETDEDALIFFGENGRELNLGEERFLAEGDLRARISGLYPDMPVRVVADLIPLVVGNMRHVEELRKQKRPPVDIEHKEWILGIGRGFDWLHMINTALLIGPFGYTLGDTIEKAAGILLDNLKSGRISEEDGVVLMASSPYRDPGAEPHLAAMKARSLATLAVQTIHARVPELWPHVKTLTGVVDIHTRLFTRTSFDVEVALRQE